MKTEDIYHEMNELENNDKINKLKNYIKDEMNFIIELIHNIYKSHEMDISEDIDILLSFDYEKSKLYKLIDYDEIENLVWEVSRFLELKSILKKL